MKQSKSARSTFETRVLFLLVGALVALTAVGARVSLSASRGTVQHIKSPVQSRSNSSDPFRYSIKQFVPTSADRKIAPEVLADTADGASAPVVIMLSDQADVSAANKIADQDERGWFVYNTLTKHADITQADLKQFLKSRNVSFRSFWAANMIVATADRTLVDLLGARGDVARVESNRPVHWIEDPELAKPEPAPNAPDTAEWGVTNVNAANVWALGFTGQGMVIGNQDTGMRWTQ